MTSSTALGRVVEDDVAERPDEPADDDAREQHPVAEPDSGPRARVRPRRERQQHRPGVRARRERVQDSEAERGEGWLSAPRESTGRNGT